MDTVLADSTIRDNQNQPLDSEDLFDRIQNATSVDIERLLQTYGQTSVTAAIAKLPAAKSVTDKQAMLYQCVAEAVVGKKLKYVGDTHVIVEFLSDTIVQIDQFAKKTWGPLTCRLDELIAT